MNEVVNFLQLVLPAMVPFILAAQGTALGGRTGIFNVSQEGTMATGASVGFLVSLGLGSNFVGVLAAAAVGGAFGFILAWTTTVLRLDQFVVGLALFFAGMGLATLLYKLVIGIREQPPLVPTLRELHIPLLSDIPLLGPVLFSQDLMVYTAFVISLVLYWVLYRTNLGMQLRAVGENPKSADSAGISVLRARLATGTIGASLMGMAGAYLPMAFSGAYSDGMVAGRGWLAIALTFLGGWRPQYIVLGAAFFAMMEVAALRMQVAGVAVPTEIVQMLPYVAVLVVMAFAFRWARQPAFLGKNYDRESRTV